MAVTTHIAQDTAPQPPPPRRPAATPLGTIPLGRIAGVPVRLNWSMLLIFWLVVWSLAEELLPSAAPDAARAADWAAALVAGVLFYASLLVHELAHSVVARRRGIEVEGITLWLFGGVARLRGEATSAQAELRIAIVGPLTSLGIAVACALVALALSALQAPALPVAVAVWLSVVNGMLAAFNVLPAFPLDGGRVLRAALWRRRGDKRSATRTAARAGTVFGWLLAAGGVVELFTTGSAGGLWFVVLGWFLVNAARSEAGQSAARDALRGVRVGDVMTRDPLVVPDWIVLQEFVDSYAMRHRFTTFPVRDLDGNVDGLISPAQAKPIPPEQRRAVRVRDVALPLSQVPTARAEEPLLDLLERMSGATATRALVLDEDRRVTGIVSPADVARVLQPA